MAHWFTIYESNEPGNYNKKRQQDPVFNIKSMFLFLRWHQIKIVQFLDTSAKLF
jgi:hypothetical protein